MRKRVTVVAAAVVLLAVALFGVVSYTSSADQRAMANLAPQVVLVASTTVPKGTAADALTPQMVERKTLPSTAIVPDAVSSTDQISGRVAAVDLQPGEQVLMSRFVDPATLSAAAAVPVPKGLQQITVTLDSQRVVGGRIVPGNLVGVFVNDNDNKRTHLVLNKALVTDIRPAASQQQGDGTAPSAPDSASLTLTLAVAAHPAEKIVWGAANGGLWISLQGPNVNTQGDRVTDPKEAVR